MQYASKVDEMHAVPQRARRKKMLNVGVKERWASAMFGAALLATALKQRGWLGFVAGAAGSFLAVRGASGYCPAYAALNISSRPALGPAHRLQPFQQRRGALVRVECSVTIARPPAEVDQFLRNPQNIPRFAAHVESIEDMGGGHFRVVPRDELVKPWDMFVDYDEKGRAIVLHHSTDPRQKLSVLLAEAPGGRGTELKVAFDVERERKALRRALTAIAGDDPDTLLREDLRRLKMLLEAGELVTVEGQSMGHGARASAVASSKIVGIS